MKPTVKLVAPATGLALLCALSAGCGGGGGSSSGLGTSSQTALAITGTVTKADGSAATGDTVTFDRTPGAATQIASSPTDSAGSFSISVLSTNVKGSDTLTVTDSGGTVVGYKQLTVSAAQSGAVTANITLPSAPPPPAPLVRH